MFRDVPPACWGTRRPHRARPPCHALRGRKVAGSPTLGDDVGAGRVPTRSGHPQPAPGVFLRSEETWLIWRRSIRRPDGTAGAHRSSAAASREQEVATDGFGRTSALVIGASPAAEIRLGAVTPADRREQAPVQRGGGGRRRAEAPDIKIVASVKFLNSLEPSRLGGFRRRQAARASPESWDSPSNAGAERRGLRRERACRVNCLIYPFLSNSD